VRRLARRGPALETALSSPWDVAWAGGALFIAMAGTHQVWRYDPGDGTVAVWAGTGHEGIRDGTRESAWLAQPMGIAALGETLMVACAETQAVREAGIASDTVKTVAGQGLFTWGSVDGPASSSLFQHNQGLDIDAQSAYVADTYNNRIRHIARQPAIVSTVAGSGTAGLLDGLPAGARFDQPGGVSVSGGQLYVADTNNHAVRVIDLDSGHVRTLRLSGL
jgi:DNA-binding beta-propeller fold protein YncE